MEHLTYHIILTFIGFSVNVILGIMVPFFGGALTNMVLPSLDIHVPELAIPLTTVNAALIAYVILRHRFLTITVEYASSTIINTMGDSLIVLGIDGRINLVNQATLQILGYKAPQIVGLPITEILRDNIFTDQMKLNFEKTGSLKTEVDFLAHSPKTAIAMSISISLLKDEKGKTVGYVCVGKDIREQKRLIQETEKAKKDLEKLVVTDPLAGLYNRRYLAQKLKEEYHRSHRYQHFFSLAVIDLDKFKEINDTYGHKEGDRVLEPFARILPL